MGIIEYSKEIGLDYTMTVEELISSHRELRNKNVSNHREWLRELEKARERGREEGFLYVTEKSYVSLDRLKSMKLGELIEIFNYTI